MKHLWKGASALAMFGASVFAATPGCVDAEAPFFIRNAKTPDCETITVESEIMLTGTFDVRYKCQYDVILELNNQLVRRADETKLQIETSRISVTGFDVQILEADGETVITRADGSPAEFSIPAAGFVDPSTTGAPGRGLASTMLIDGATAQSLGEAFFDNDPSNNRTLVVARVVAHGRTLGGSDVTSRPWDFPINVCYGCLCFCDPDVESTETCAHFQDIPFSCEYVNSPQGCLIDSQCLTND